MTEKFDPAPLDKHAEKPTDRTRHDRQTDNELDKGLKESFPASDVPSTTQPSETKNTKK